jgi:hypothetical protein
MSPVPLALSLPSVFSRLMYALVAIPYCERRAPDQVYQAKPGRYAVNVAPPRPFTPLED